MPRDPDDGRPPVTPKSLAADALICTAVLGGFYIWRTRLRRIPRAEAMPQSIFKRRTLLGKVVSVGDADNFRFYHTPGGYLAGWGWLRHTPPVNERGISGETIHIRLAGVDAPEAAHFGKPAQPYSQEALQWLRRYILGRRVRVVPLSRDQYQRIVGEARVWKLTGRKNVSEEMLRNGWAVVYEGKTGAEFNGLKSRYLKLQKKAQGHRYGIFSQGANIETPGQFKRRTA